MRRVRRSIGIGAILTLVLGIAAVALLGGTMVLGLLGAESTVVWTGTAGCVCLAGWLLAVNANRRHRGTRS